MAQPEPVTPLNLLTPLLLLSYSAYYLPPTILQLLRNGELSTLLNFESLKSVWFANFWAWFGPQVRENAAVKVTPLLKNNAHGVCLDIGPGSGQWLYLFAKADNPSITKIYGVEPNVGLHAELRANAIKAGLDDVYEIIGCGAQDLITKAGLQPASIDTIITVQCLCSIPDPETNIVNLVPLLKSGGVWLVYEHIKTKYQANFVGYWQKLVNLIWPHFFGGCSLTRPTDEWLLRAGEWSEIHLKSPPEEGPYNTVPHVMGHLVKK